MSAPMTTLQNALLDDLDGLNSTRALILQAYYSIRRFSRPTQIGVREIATWIQHYEPNEALPSDALIQLTLAQAQIRHRSPGRPRHDSHVAIPAPPFLPPLPTRPLVSGRR